MKIFMNEEKENCKMAKGLFVVLREKFTQLCCHWNSKTAVKKKHESTQEWIEKLWIQAAEYDYTEYDRALTKQFIHGLSDEDMTSEILRKVFALEDNNDTTCQCISMYMYTNAHINTYVHGCICVICLHA